MSRPLPRLATVIELEERCVHQTEPLSFGEFCDEEGNPSGAEGECIPLERAVYVQPNCYDVDEMERWFRQSHDFTDPVRRVKLSREIIRFIQTRWAELHPGALTEEDETEQRRIRERLQREEREAELRAMVYARMFKELLVVLGVGGATGIGVGMLSREIAQQGVLFLVLLMFGLLFGKLSLQQLQRHLDLLQEVQRIVQQYAQRFGRVLQLQGGERLRGGAYDKTELFFASPLAVEAMQGIENLVALLALR